MNTDERLQVLKGKDIIFITRLCLSLADDLRKLGDTENITKKL